jgi:hypothetical protein
MFRFRTGPTHSIRERTPRTSGESSAAATPAVEAERLVAARGGLGEGFGRLAVERVVVNARQAVAGWPLDILSVFIDRGLSR